MLPKNRLCQKVDRAGGHARTPERPVTLQKKFRQQLPSESATSADDPVTSTLAGIRRGAGELRFFRQGSGEAGSGEGIARAWREAWVRLGGSLALPKGEHWGFV